LNGFNCTLNIFRNRTNKDLAIIQLGLHEILFRRIPALTLGPRVWSLIAGEVIEFKFRPQARTVSKKVWISIRKLREVKGYVAGKEV
jgi:hypothetical protein